MPELQRLSAEHAPAVLAFELANRAYFSAFISDRGDAHFDEFAARHAELLAEQATAGQLVRAAARTGVTAQGFRRQPLPGAAPRWADWRTEGVGRGPGRNLGIDVEEPDSRST